MSIKSIEIVFSDRKGELLQDIIELQDEQVNIIKKESIKKTENGWKKTKSGVKVKLTEDQKKVVLKCKNDILKPGGQTLTPQELFDYQIVDFREHSLERVSERIEGNPRSVPDEKTLFEIIQVLIDSERIADHFEWKGYPGLAFKFLGYNLEFQEIGIVCGLSPESDVLVITIVVENLKHGTLGSIVKITQKTKTS